MCENTQDLVDATASIAASLDEVPDPWEGTHDSEYWIWNGTRLVPASADQIQSIREQERTRDALWRLEQWEAAQRHISSQQRMRKAFARVTRLLPRRATSLPRRSIPSPTQGASPATCGRSKWRAEA